MPSVVVAAQTAICRPQLQVDGQSYEAGTAFVLKGERPLLLTAQHLFGPDGGLKASIRWQDMPKRATSVSCKKIGTAGAWSSGPAFAIDGAHAMTPDDESGSVNDVATFPLISDGDAVPTLSLSATAPSVGARVWLIASLLGGGKNDPLLHAATVVASQNGALLFSYDDPKINLDATSGAPIVDSSGKVVGLNLGGGYDAEAHAVIGVADDLRVIAKAVALSKAH